MKTGENGSGQTMMDYTMMTEPTDKTIRMASDLHQRVKIEAAKRGVTVRDLVEQAVREWLDRREQQEETHDDR